LILLDASGLFAAINPDQALHEPARSALDAEPPPYVLSPFALAELDYLTLSRGSVAPELALLRQVANEAYELASFDARDVAAAADVIERYRDLGIGLADASIVVLAGRYRTDRVLTLDERHLRTLRTPSGDPFVVLPADA
jgi:predicted nucleic acid-binding protein